MKKIFKLIAVVILFVFSLSIFKHIAAIVGKAHKSHMAKLV